MKHLTVIFLIVVAGCRPVQNVGEVAARPVSVRVIDNMTKTPVAGAIVTCRDAEAASDSTGLARFAGAPNDAMTITHQRYRKHEMPVPQLDTFQVAIDLHDDHVEFDGGMSSFYQHVQNKITYPTAARNARAQVKLWVEFVVEPDGKSRIVRVHDPSRFFSKEIAKVFQTIPAGWGKRYAGMTFLLPITFVISDANALEADFEPLRVPRHRVMSELVVTAHLN